jgi:DNA-binding NarL/FixJ family response regulator
MKAKPVSKLRIFLADNHTLLREALKLLVDSQPDMEVIGEAEDGRAAWLRAKSLQPDLVVMDLSMPDLNGAQATVRLKQANPNVKILVLTRHNDSGSLRLMLEAGASGYLLKSAASNELINAIRSVASGVFYVDPTLKSKLNNFVQRRFVGKASQREELSEQQIEVLRRYALGYGIKEIASQLNVSPKTVETHKARAEEKLDLHSRADIVQYALHRGWLHDSC